MPRGEPTVVIQGRVSPEDREKIEAEARRRGVKLAVFVRDAVLKEAGLGEHARKQSKRHAPPTRPPRASADSGVSATPPLSVRGTVSRSADVVRKPAFGTKAPK